MSVEVESNPIHDESKAHLIQDLIAKTKNKTLEIYSQNILKNEKLQTSIKKLNEFSEPYIVKYSALINTQIDRTLKKIILHKDDFKLLQKVSEAREKFIGLGDKVLSDAETHVSHYYNNLPQVEEQQEEKSQELEVTIKPRIQLLMKKVNSIARFWVKSLWVQLKQQKLDKETIKQIIENVQERINLWENIANAKILMELSYEYLNEQIYHPTINNLKITLQETQKSVVVSFEGLRHKGLKELIQEASQKAQGLKDVSVEFYKNKVLVHINKETLKALGDNSRKAIMGLVDQLKDTDALKVQAKELKTKGVEKSLDLYTKTLEKLKLRKENVKDRYLIVAKAVAERKMEKETLRQKEIHEDKSTDHKSESDEQHD